MITTQVICVTHSGDRKALSLFNSVEEELRYLKNHVSLDECHADVLSELGRYREAADIHVKGDRTVAAVRVLLKDRASQRSAQVTNHHLLQGLWQNTSFSAKIKDRDTVAVELLSLASKLNWDSLTPTQKDEVGSDFTLATQGSRYCLDCDVQNYQAWPGRHWGLT